SGANHPLRIHPLPTDVRAKRQPDGFGLRIWLCGPGPLHPRFQGFHQQNAQRIRRRDAETSGNIPRPRKCRILTIAADIPRLRWGKLNDGENNMKNKLMFAARVKDSDKASDFFNDKPTAAGAARAYLKFLRAAEMADWEMTGGDYVLPAFAANSFHYGLGRKCRCDGQPMEMSHQGRNVASVGHDHFAGK